MRRFITHGGPSVAQHRAALVWRHAEADTLHELRYAVEQGQSLPWSARRGEQTVLEWAAEQGKVAAVEFLLDTAKVRAHRSEALILAVRHAFLTEHQQSRLVSAFLRSGLKPHKPVAMRLRHSWAHEAPGVTTVLHEAVRSDWSGVALTRLLEHSHKPYTVCDHDHQTLMGRALEVQQQGAGFHTIQTLLSHGGLQAMGPHAKGSMAYVLQRVSQDALAAPWVARLGQAGASVREWGLDAAKRPVCPVTLMAQKGFAGALRQALNQGLRLTEPLINPHDPQDAQCALARLCQQPRLSEAVFDELLVERPEWDAPLPGSMDTARALLAVHNPELAARLSALTLAESLAEGLDLHPRARRPRL